MTVSQHSDRYKQFCTLLIEHRKEAGLKQSEVAENLNKPQSYVSKYESAERRLDVVELIDVAKAIGFDPKAIIDQLADT